MLFSPRLLKSPEEHPGGEMKRILAPPGPKSVNLQAKRSAKHHHTGTRERERESERERVRTRMRMRMRMKEREGCSILYPQSPINPKLS